jgi:hypothetical protein
MNTAVYQSPDLVIDLEGVVLRLSACGKLYAGGAAPVLRCFLPSGHEGQHESKGGAMWPEGSC